MLLKWTLVYLIIFLLLVYSILKGLSCKFSPFPYILKFSCFFVFLCSHYGLLPLTPLLAGLLASNDKQLSHLPTLAINKDGKFLTISQDQEKSRIRETPNLWTNADSSTGTFSPNRTTQRWAPEFWEISQIQEFSENSTENSTQFLFYFQNWSKTPSKALEWFWNIEKAPKNSTEFLQICQKHQKFV